jgi:predicted CXXCH cytochrome family protein
MAVCGLLAGVAAAAAAEQCGVCHPESRVAFADSTHAAEGVACTGCHGGDPASRDPVAAHRGEFRPLDDRLLIPAACAVCHASLDQMRAYNLPVDQYAVYLTSQHGRASARGERRAAVCTDCHGSHRVLGPADPESPVNHRRLVGTCARCHGDQGLMEAFDLDPDVVDDYRSGVHGKALLEGGRGAAPDCTSCHGVHGAAPPGYGDIDKVCGACHADTRAAYLAGPHYEAMRAAGLPECVSCHENHGVRSFELSAIEAECEECHEAGSEQVKLGRQLYTVLLNAGEEIDAAEALTVEARRAALHVEDHLSRLEEARTYVTEALPLVHSVQLEPVEALARRARSIGEEVRHELYEKMDRRPAHIGLAVFWFYILMTLAVLVVYKRRGAAER